MREPSGRFCMTQSGVFTIFDIAQILTNPIPAILQAKLCLPAQLTLLLIYKIVEAGSAVVLGRPLLYQLGLRLGSIRAIDGHGDCKFVDDQIPVCEDLLLEIR